MPVAIAPIGSTISGDCRDEKEFSVMVCVSALFSASFPKHGAARARCRRCRCGGRGWGDFEKLDQVGKRLDGEDEEVHRSNDQ